MLQAANNIIQNIARMINTMQYSAFIPYMAVYLSYSCIDHGGLMDRYGDEREWSGYLGWW